MVYDYKLYDGLVLLAQGVAWREVTEDDVVPGATFYKVPMMGLQFNTPQAIATQIRIIRLENDEVFYAVLNQQEEIALTEDIYDMTGWRRNKGDLPEYAYFLPIIPYKE